MGYISRREMIKYSGLVAGAFLAGAGDSAASDKTLHIASNQYSWSVYFGRDGRDFNKPLEDGFKAVAASGMNGFEPLATEPEQIALYAPLIKANGLEMRSLYVNSVLHDRQKATESIDSVLAIAEKAKSAGTKIIVTNPSPIQWGDSKSKDDGQLKIQAASLETLGKKLAAMGMTLAYHNHDIELRNAAREFHHMMVGTDPQYVKLCLDSHWVYRGSGDSAVALFDIVKLYASRIVELHLRQSNDGIWSETFAEGDIDYTALASCLLKARIKPHIVLEQAPEKGTPKTMTTVPALRKSCEYARRIFAGF